MVRGEWSTTNADASFIIHKDDAIIMLGTSRNMEVSLFYLNYK